MPDQLLFECVFSDIPDVDDAVVTACGEMRAIRTPGDVGKPNRQLLTDPALLLRQHIPDDQPAARASTGEMLPIWIPGYDERIVPARFSRPQQLEICACCQIP